MQNKTRIMSVKQTAGQLLSEGKSRGGNTERIKAWGGQQYGDGWKQEFWW